MRPTSRQKMMSWLCSLSIDGGDRLVAAGGGLPADVAIIVVGRVIAVVAELPAGSRQPFGTVAAGADQGGAHQGLVAAHLEQVGIDLHVLAGGQEPVGPGQPQRPAAAHGQVAESEVAALGRQQPVANSHLAVPGTRGVEQQRTRPANAGGGRSRRTSDAAPARQVIDDQDDLVFHSQRQPGGPVTADAQAARLRTSTSEDSVSATEQQHRGVEAQGQPATGVRPIGQQVGKQRSDQAG